MKKDNLKISEIAEMAGISEEEARIIAKKHGDKIPSRSLGRIEIYEEAAVERFRKFAEKSGAEPEAESEPVSRRDRVLPRREPGRAPERGPPGMQDSVALQEQQIKRLTGRINGLDRQASEEREDYEVRISLLERQIIAQQKQMEVMDSWISFFEAGMEESTGRAEARQKANLSWQRETTDKITWLRLPWWKRLHQAEER